MPTIKYTLFRMTSLLSHFRVHMIHTQVSTIKYTLVKQIIQMGYNTLVTDMDLVYMKNPFDHLHK